ncbi:YcxB family protein [Sediminitomix flava]|uniref:YcxB-like protein n=1 Tax=Sediminitomix flava TaxID=379075 RepID=A0A315ZIN4_SEDFL|nr:YcxB family protein [Sediminitomix flava]PWJ44564.1 YcxB-like protein [Sediminitomix flava]
MKKFFGLCLTLFSLFTILALIYSFYVFYKNSALFTELNLSTFQIIGICLVVAFFILLSVAGIIHGIRLLTRNESTTVKSEFNHELNIEFKGKLNYADYRNLILRKTLNKPIFLVTPFAMFFLILLVSSNTLNNLSELEHLVSSLVITLLAIVLLSSMTIKQIRRTFYTNKIFQEEIQYTLTNQSIDMKGDTFESVINWERFIQISEDKNYILLYQDHIIATFLDKKMFSSDELILFRSFLDSLGLKHKS